MFNLIISAIVEFFKTCSSAFEMKKTDINAQAETDIIKTKNSLKSACDVVPSIFITTYKIIALYERQEQIFKKYYEPKYLDKRILRATQKALSENKKDIEIQLKKISQLYKNFEKLD